MKARLAKLIVVLGYGGQFFSYYYFLWRDKMKAKLEFDLDCSSDSLAFKRATTATSAYLVLWNVAMEIFRPARKHGYRNIGEDKVLDINTWSDQTVQVVEALESRFYEMLKDYDVSLEDLE
jgi:hypothetical protein